MSIPKKALLLCRRMVGGSSVNAVEFDGTNDYLSRVTPSGLSDGTDGLISFWLNPAADAVKYSILDNDRSQGFPGIQVQRNSSNKIRIDLTNDAGDMAVRLDSTADVLAGAWHHIAASWTLNATSASRVMHLYVDGVDVKSVVANSGSSALSVGYVNDTNSWVVAAQTSPFSAKYAGCVAEFLFTPSYLNLSVGANLEKLRTAAGKPADLGADGSAVTGAQPLIYLKGVAAAFGANSGSGGDFTITGTLAVCGTSPSD